MQALRVGAKGATMNQGTSSQAAAAAEPSLQRVMGPWLLLLFIVGDILGTGIYALTGQVAKQVGWSRSIPRPPAPPSTRIRHSAFTS